jgi:hypothetical protein
MPRWAPIAIALAAGAAQAAGAADLAFYLLLAAVPVTAAAALAAFGELLDARVTAPAEPETMLAPFLSGLALLLLVAGSAVGEPAFALSGCLSVFVVQVLVGLRVELRRPASALER